MLIGAFWSFRAVVIGDGAGAEIFEVVLVGGRIRIVDLGESLRAVASDQFHFVEAVEIVLLRDSQGFRNGHQHALVGFEVGLVVTILAQARAGGPGRSMVAAMAWTSATAPASTTEIDVALNSVRPKYSLILR